MKSKNILYHSPQDSKTETGGRRFVPSHYNLSASKINFYKDVLRFGGIMIVVGGMCQERQMSGGFGNNRTEGWMFCRGCFRQRTTTNQIPLFYRKEFQFLFLVQCITLSVDQMFEGNYTCEVEWNGNPLSVTHTLTVLQVRLT